MTLVKSEIREQINYKNKFSNLIKTIKNQIQNGKNKSQTVTGLRNGQSRPGCKYLGSISS